MSKNKKEHTLLITDDEKINLDILVGILSPQYNLLISTDGPRTLELAHEHMPDLILLDIVMPGMSGFEVITKLKNSDVTDKIPVIFITGLSSADDEEKAFFLGAADYITKPFHKSTVKARVNNHIKILEQMRIIERIGLIDPTTKLTNRRGFENRLKADWGKSLLEKTPMSILLLDVDHFKNYNDTYGHLQGDTALKTLAEIAAKTLQRRDDLAARWGGEEFVILLPGANIGRAEEIAEKLRKNIEAVNIHTEQGLETKITVSIGINTVIPDENTCITEFVNKADQALYRAKESGRNKVVKMNCA